MATTLHHWTNGATLEDLRVDYAKLIQDWLKRAGR